MGNTADTSQYGVLSGATLTIESVIANNLYHGRTDSDGADNVALFLAYLTSLSDDMTSAWNEEQVYGRQDPIGTFQNTTRKISIGFDIPAKNLGAAKKNLNDINKVKQFMYPAYSSSTTPASGSNPEVTTNALSLAKSPLVRLKFANLIQNHEGKGLLGWLNSFSANPVIEMGMFNEGTLNEAKFYPKVYNATLTFTPQHEFDLGFKSPDGLAIDTASFPSFPYGG